MCHATLFENIRNLIFFYSKYYTCIGIWNTQFCESMNLDIPLFKNSYSFHHNGYADTITLTDIVERDWKKSLKLIQIPLWNRHSFNTAPLPHHYHLTLVKIHGFYLYCNFWNIVLYKL